jgi:hypothetical protein
MTDMEGDGICCEFGIGEFKITVNGAPEAVGNNGEFGDVIRETFDVYDAPTGNNEVLIEVTHDDFPEGLLVSPPIASPMWAALTPGLHSSLRASTPLK